MQDKLTEQKGIRGFSGLSLKWIAIITMLIDHTGATLFPQYTLLRIIGRIAFPLFAFLLVEGFFHTKQIHKYMIRLGAFMLISEVFFDLSLYHSLYDPLHQNVFFTLFIGLCTIWGMEFFRKNVNLLLSFGIAVLGMVIAYSMHTDYSAYGIGIIVMFYLGKLLGNRSVGCIGVILYVILRFSSVRVFSLLALPFIYFYNETRGAYVKGMKYFFYIFYPLHLGILYILRIWLFKGTL